MNVTNVLWRVLHWWINLAPNFATYDEPESFPQADRWPTGDMVYYIFSNRFYEPMSSAYVLLAVTR